MLFWSCPSIQIIWREVAKKYFIGLVFQYYVSLTTVYLGNVPDGLSKTDVYPLKVLLAASRKAITKRWLQKNATTTDTFVNLVKGMHALQQLTRCDSKKT